MLLIYLSVFRYWVFECLKSVLVVRSFTDFVMNTNISY